MEVQYPWMLFALFAVPVVIMIWLLMMRWKKRAMERFGDVLIHRMTADYSPLRQTLKFVFFILAFSFIVIGIANPRIGTKMEKVKHHGRDVIICLDISNSMLARDIKPNRLERSKMAVSKLIDEMEGDQVGLAVFAGTAQMQFPLTPDYAGAKMYLNALSTEFISIQGTAIGSALELATGSFNFRSPSKKVIILMSDGENHEDDALGAAERAADKGILIYTVGLGSPEGSPIPISTSASTLEFKTDEHGNTVITKLDESTLQQIARIGKGTYTRASSGDAGLETIYEEIDKLEKAEYEAPDFSEYENLYPYLIGLGLLLLAVEFVIFERRTRLTRNIHLFSKPASDYVIGKKE